MKKKLIIILSVALVAVIALGAILFWPKGNNGGNELQQDEKGVYYLDEDNVKVYKIVMMDHGVPLTTTEFKYRQLVLDKLNEKLLNDRGYKVDIQIDVYSDDTFADKLGFALADGEHLDIVRQASKELLTSYVSQGITKDITKFTNAATSLQQNIPAEMWAETQYDGSTYAIPLDRLATNTVGFVRGDLLEKAGYDELVTIADWEGFMKKVQDGGTDYLNSRMETVPVMGAFTSFEEMFYGYFTKTPGNFFDNEGKIRPKYFDEGYKSFILKMREWLQKGYIDSSMFNFNEFAMKEYMSSEITGAIISGIYHLEFGSLLQVHKAHPEWEISPAMPVATSEGKYASNGLMGEYLFVPYCAKSAGVAVELMDWALYNKENYMLLRCGIEGTTYVINEDNSIDVPEAEKDINVTNPNDLIGRFILGTSVEFNMSYPTSTCPEGAKKAYAKSLEIKNDKLYVDPTIYVNEKLNDNEIAVRASADTEMMKVVQNLLTLNKDGSFKIPNDEFDATWASMLSSYKGFDVYNKLTDEYNNKFNN